jgi:hypothetical protein
MQRSLVVLALVVAATVAPAGMVPGSDSAGAASAVPDRPEARADFDGDGAQDLAVGVPFESVGTVEQAGAVNVLYGSAGTGLSAAGSQLFTQDTAGIGSTAEPFDTFGEALAVGDVDGDGIDDLAVSASGEAVGPLEQAGAVNVIYGSAVGLNGGRPSQLLTEDTVGGAPGAATFALFGDAVTIGDLDGDGIGDLAIGAPGTTVGPDNAAGLLDVVYGSSTGLGGGRPSRAFTQDSPGVGSDAEFNDFFGSSLTTGDVDGSGIADLAVGVRFETVGTVEAAGAVNVLFGSPAGLDGTGQLFHQGVAGIGSDPEFFDQFGVSVDAGDFDASGDDDLAIGAHGESVGATEFAGAINVIYGAQGGLNTGRPSQLFHQGTSGIGSDPEPDDSFGFAVAAGDFDADGRDDLGVGAPFETVGDVRFAGALNVVFGSPGGLVAAGSQLFHQGTAGVASDPEESDTFGFALATSDFGEDGFTDLAGGVAAESVGTVSGAGAIHVLPGRPTGLAGSGSQLFHQGTAGIGSAPEFFDQFGYALAAPESQSTSSSSTSPSAAATTPGPPARRAR